MGLQEKDNSSTMIEVAAWASMRLDFLEPVTIMEESERWNPFLTEEIFGNTHLIQHRNIDALNFGWAGRRVRYWASLFSKEYVSEVYSSLSNVIDMFARVKNPDLSWHCFFIADDEESPFSEFWMKGELVGEILWAAARPSSLARVRGLSMAQVHKLAPEGKYKAVMTQPELDNVTYCETQRPHCICMANQRPGYEISSRTNKHMFTILKNPSFHYSHVHHRWLSASEVLIVNGFPVTEKLADPYGEPGFCCSFVSLGYDHDTRVRNRIIEQSGNSMNVAVAGFMMLYSLLWSRRTDESAAGYTFHQLAQRLT